MRLLRLFAAVMCSVWIVSGAAAWAQHEVAGGAHRYKTSEMSTGYYEEYEVKPSQTQPFLEYPDSAQKQWFRLRPGEDPLRYKTLRADSHIGVENYEAKTCKSCHSEQARNNRHVVREGITCRQCHGREPIPSNDFYFSPMNPIRRHAYVCAKCHEGASASYATYQVHVPSPEASETRVAFPGLYYVYWLMVILFVAVMAFFLLHSILIGIREVIAFIKGRS